MKPTDKDLRKFLKLGLTSVGEAGDRILSERARGFTTDTKADGSFVTSVDTAVERMLRRDIHAAFPDHDVLGEEFGANETPSDYRWYIDPIDGTLAFKLGLPFYGTILCLTWRDRPIVGIISHPSMQLTYHAVMGQGAFRNGRPIRSGNVRAREREISEEMIGTGDRYAFRLARSHKVWSNLQKKLPLVRTMPDCVGHTQAAQGSIGAMVDYHLNVWDFMATRLLIEEAGGKFVILGTNNHADGKTTYNIVCGKRGVVDWLRRNVLG